MTTCSLGNPIIGKWQRTQSVETIEFFRDGHFVIDIDFMVMTGEYELVGDEYIKVDFGGIAGSLLTELGGNTWRYKFRRGFLNT